MTSCKKGDMSRDANSNVGPATTSSSGTQPIKQTFAEGFWSGTKTSYAAASASLNISYGPFNNALIGTSSSDPENERKSVCITATGTVGINLNVLTGRSTVTLKYGVYGPDGSSTLKLCASLNSDSSYTEIGSTITAS